ncbi:MAG: hypothetical protein E6J90_13425, partial [Deltaproteobacteria bacterium]
MATIGNLAAAVPRAGIAGASWTFVKRWQHYWSAPGGRIAVAVLRIAIGASLLWSIARIAGHATV